MGLKNKFAFSIIKSELVHSCVQGILDLKYYPQIIKPWSIPICPNKDRVVSEVNSECNTSQEHNSLIFYMFL